MHKLLCMQKNYSHRLLLSNGACVYPRRRAARSDSRSIRELQRNGGARYGRACVQQLLLLATC